MRQVSRTWRIVCSDDLLWIKRFISTYGNANSYTSKHGWLRRYWTFASKHCTICGVSTCHRCPITKIQICLKCERVHPEFKKITFNQALRLVDSAKMLQPLKCHRKRNTYNSHQVVTLYLRKDISTLND